MSQKNNKSSTNNNLEKKVDLFGRLKYVVLPAALTVGTYFIPEIKNKYNDLNCEKKDDYVKKTLVGTSILGITLAAFSGYKLFRKYDNQNTKNDQFLIEK